MLLKLENSSKKIHNALQEDLQMVEATSCGGVVIYRGKILTLYKSYKNRYEGWVLPKGTVEEGEEYHETALREVKEEAGVQASIIKYVGKSQYSFNIQNDVVGKRCTLVFDVSEQLSQQTTTGRVFCGFRILQISRGLPSAEIFQ